MSAWIVVSGFLLHFLGFSSADGAPVDALLFNENMDPLQNTDLFDSITSLTSNANLNGGDLDLFDPVLDTGSDLFAGVDDFNSIVDPAFVAGCAPSINGIQGKKARLRRQKSCENTYSETNLLRLPTLNQASKKRPKGPPYRPETPDEIDRAGYLNIITTGTGASLRLLDVFLKGCFAGHKVCSSGNPEDTSLDSDGLAILFRGRDRTFSFGFALFFPHAHAPVQ